jgi:outer membrane lipoprotein SlyB
MGLRPRAGPARAKLDGHEGRGGPRSPRLAGLEVSGYAGRQGAASWRKAFAVAGIVAILEGCAFQSGTTYSPGETGTVMRVESAQVVSSRPVVISGLDDSQAAGWGTAIGATVAGAAAYGITEADNPAGVAVIIIAAVVGGLAGLLGEERRQTRSGIEYILRDEQGQTIAIVQSVDSSEEIQQPGAAVSLIHGAGGYVRVVPTAKLSHAAPITDAARGA